MFDPITVLLIWACLIHQYQTFAYGHPVNHLVLVKFMCKCEKMATTMTRMEIICQTRPYVSMILCVCIVIPTQTVGLEEQEMFVWNRKIQWRL